MKKIRVALKDRSYDISIESGLLNKIPKILKVFNRGQKWVLITQEKLMNLYGNGLVQNLALINFDISTIILKVAMKPIPTLIKPLKSIDIMTKEEKLAHKERTDSCAVPAASIIAESMLALSLADALLEKFGGDSIQQLNNHIRASGKY